MSGYVPLATATEVGAIKPDNTTITVDADGTAHAEAGALHNLELTDGTHDVLAVAKITTTHMDVGGVSAAATLVPSTATPTQLGIVTVDNTTVFVDEAGVLHAGASHSAVVSSTAGTGHVKDLDSGSDARFNATNDYLTTGTVIESGTGDWTIAAWVKLGPVGANFGVIVSEIGTENAAGQHQLRMDGFTPQVIRRTGSGNAIVVCTAAAPLTAGVWTHVVALCNAGALTLWVNGANVGSTTSSGVYTAVAANTTNIGSMEGGAVASPEYMFDGDMSDVRIYGATLSGSDIASLAGPGVGAYPSVQPGEMLAQWKFDEGSGTTAADSSGNGHTATWHGTGVHWGHVILNAPPANWQLATFTEDGSWKPSVLQTGTVPATAPAPAQWLCYTAVDFENSGQWLIRYFFDLPAGVPSGAALVLGVDIFCLDCYVNGVQIAAAVAHDYTSSEFPSFTIPAGVLIAGGSNLLAIRIGNDADAAPNPSSVAFQIGGSVVQSTGLEIEHDGTAVGTRPILNFIEGTGAVISAADDATDNRVNVTIGVTGTSTIGVDLSGTLVGSEPAINLIPGSNVGLTVADNPTHGRVDITVTANGSVGPSGGQSGSVPITIAAGTASNTAAVTFSPGFANPPVVVVSSSSGDVIASCESITASGFTARLTANVNLAPGTSITATLYWSIGGLRPGGKFKLALMRQLR